MDERALPIEQWADQLLKTTAVRVPGLRQGELRRARLRLGWTQDQLTERITVLRDRKLGGNYPPFTVAQIGRLESGRVRVCLGDEATEPIWWALLALNVVLADKRIGID